MDREVLSKLMTPKLATKDIPKITAREDHPGGVEDHDLDYVAYNLLIAGRAREAELVHIGTNLYNQCVDLESRSKTRFFFASLFGALFAILAIINIIFAVS